jgi:hypothetical protein
MHKLQCTIYNAQITVDNLQCTICSAQFTVHSLQCTIYSKQFTLHNLQYTIYSAKFTVQNLKKLSCILLFYSRTAHRVQAQCFASVWPTGTVRIPGLASWIFVLLGFTVDCEYKLNWKIPDDTDNGYHVYLEIQCKFSRLTDRKLSTECTYLPWKFKHYTELELYLLEQWGYVTVNCVLVRLGFCDKTGDKF